MAKRLEDMLWRNIRQIRSENDEQFARWVLEARSDFLRLRLRQEPALRKIYIDAADNVAKEIRGLKPGVSGLTLNHLKELEKSLRREADRISKGVADRLGTDIPQAVQAGASALNQQMLHAIKAAGALAIDPARVQRGFGSVNSAAVEAIWARTHKGMMLSNRIWQTGDKATDAMRAILRDAVARGRDAVKVARDLERYVRHGAGTLANDYPGMMERMKGRVPKNLSYEAMRLARTEMSNAFREGTYAAGRANPSYKGVRWFLSSSHPIEDICDDYASADLYRLGPGGYPQGEEPPMPHPNCVIAGTEVLGPKTLAVTTRWYQGEVIQIQTASGNNLTVTPNHPILTPNGWVAAGLLVEGNYVISSRRGDGDSFLRSVLSVVSPDDYQVPTLVEDVARAFDEPLGVSSVTVPVTSKDFHGDGEGSEICVIRANRLLASHAKSTLSQQSLQLEFLFRCMELFSFASAGGSAKRFKRFLATTNSFMRSFNVSPILFGRSVGMNNSLSLFEVANIYAGIFQLEGYGASGYSVLEGQGFDGFTSKIFMDDFIGRESIMSIGPMKSRKLGAADASAFRTRAEATSLKEDLPHSLISNMMVSGSVVEALSGAIIPDRIVYAHRISDFMGHVYNLQTTDGWYCANNIVTHNCLCYVVPIVEDTPKFVERLEHWIDDPDSEPELEKWYQDIYRA